MEKKINKVIENYLCELKCDIKDRFESFNLESNDSNNLLQFIIDYPCLKLTKEHFQKRKRIKNFVQIYDRCCAKRANDDQCTRRKKEGSCYCGTHMKGTPHGVFNSTEPVTISQQKIDVWAQDIKGIIYYIDSTGNVYQTQDIISNIDNPKVIARYRKVDDNYTIPELNI